MQLDGATHLLSDAHADGEDEEEDEGVTELVELHITPADESTCTPPPTFLLVNISPFTFHLPWNFVRAFYNCSIPILRRTM